MPHPPATASDHGLPTRGPRGSVVHGISGWVRDLAGRTCKAQLERAPAQHPRERPDPPHGCAGTGCRGRELQGRAYRGRKKRSEFGPFHKGDDIRTPRFGDKPRGRCWSARPASSPPAPARISSTIFFSSLGSLGKSASFKTSSSSALSFSSLGISSFASCRNSSSFSFSRM